MSDPSGEAWKSLAYSTGDMELLIARLRFAFEICERSAPISRSV
jgi:hypothetical protein